MNETGKLWRIPDHQQGICPQVELCQIPLEAGAPRSDDCGVCNNTPQGGAIEGNASDDALMVDQGPDPSLTLSIALCYLHPPVMDTKIFVIKSLTVQNGIMLTFLGAALTLFVHGIVRRRPKQVAVFAGWLILILWFFNSPLFGFSAVSVSPHGIRLHYGILSFRKDRLLLDAPWEVKTYFSGIRRNKRLYYIAIGDHQSMKVRGEEKRLLLQRIGESIDRARSGSTGH